VTKVQKSLVEQIIEESKKRKKLLKRSYTLKESTIKKLQELKVYHFPASTKYNDIVDMAICDFYKKKLNKMK
jgi:hypothetical protein